MVPAGLCLLEGLSRGGSFFARNAKASFRESPTHTSRAFRTSDPSFSQHRSDAAKRVHHQLPVPSDKMRYLYNVENEACSTTTAMGLNLNPTPRYRLAK